MIRKFRYSSSKEELNQNKKHQFAQWHALSLYSSDAIYSFIPKNACSTLRLSLAIQNGCIDNSSCFEWIHQNNNTFKADLASLAKAKYTFVVLRCPYSRLASVYLDKIVGHEFVAKQLYCQLNGIAINKEIKIQPLRKMRERAQAKKCRDYINSLSFYNFIQLLEKDATMNSNIHWRPQVDFLVYQDYDKWLCVEDFSKAVQTLKGDIGLEVVDARQLTLHGISGLKKITDKSFSNTPSLAIQEMKRQGECPSPMSLYNDATIEAVSKLYSEDINLYKTIFGTKNLMFP